MTVSDDGFKWAAIREWTFDDGRPPGSYNTQQHWLAHGDGLFLVYSRRGADNDHIPRHRAPAARRESAGRQRRHGRVEKDWGPLYSEGTVSDQRKQVSDCAVGDTSHASFGRSVPRPIGTDDPGRSVFSAHLPRGKCPVKPRYLRPCSGRISLTRSAVQVSC